MRFATLAASLVAAATARAARAREVAPPPHEKELPHLSLVHRDFLTDATAAREKHGDVIRFYIEKGNISVEEYYGNALVMLYCTIGKVRDGDGLSKPVQARLDFKKSAAQFIG